MPRVQTTTTVKVALVCLPIYLVVMMSLILLKFVGSCSASGKASAPSSSATNAAPTAARQP